MKKIIDSIQNIEIDIDEYNNELQSLMHLQYGLISLYNNVKNIEKSIIEKYPNQNVAFTLNAIELPSEIMNLLPCLFHWFGISICNYSRLVGYVVSREQGLVTEADLYPNPNTSNIKLHCNNYIRSISEIEEILKWRNKVAAHFALTDPRPSDNIATMEASIIYPVAFVNNRFKTGTEIYGRGDANNVYESEIPQWSLTESFEIIATRFWPEIQFNI